MTISNTYTLNVDIKRRLTSVVPTFKQGDTAILRFRVYDDGTLFDLSTFTNSEITFRLPSGAVLIGNPELQDGQIVYNLTGTEMNEVGKVQTVLSIRSGSTQVSIQPFNIFIFDSMRDEDSSYIGILQNLVTEVQNLNLEIDGVLAQVQDTLQLSQEQLQIFTDMVNADRTSEQNRVTAENGRVSEENTRVSNENTRISNENTRQSQESTRVNNENSRISSEQARVNAEIIREQNENMRLQNLSNLNFFDYNSQATYYHYNLVTYQGSTYTALREVTGIAPNDDKINWSLLARKGTDGSGLISTINNELPDAQGNINIPIVTVEDSTTSASTTNAISVNRARIINDTVNINHDEFTQYRITHDNNRASLTSLGHVNHGVINVTLLASNWTSLNPGYSQVINNSSIFANDFLLIKPVLNTNNSSIARIQLAAFNMISREVPTLGSIRFECFDNLPNIDIPIQIKIIR